MGIWRVVGHIENSLQGSIVQWCLEAAFPSNLIKSFISMMLGNEKVMIGCGVGLISLVLVSVMVRRVRT
jgi:hypothetical protein